MKTIVELYNTAENKKAGTERMVALKTLHNIATIKQGYPPKTRYETYLVLDLIDPKIH